MIVIQPVVVPSPREVTFQIIEQCDSCGSLLTTSGCPFCGDWSVVNSLQEELFDVEVEDDSLDLGGQADRWEEDRRELAQGRE